MPDGLRRIAETGFTANITEVRIEPQEIVVSGDWVSASKRRFVTNRTAHFEQQYELIARGRLNSPSRQSRRVQSPLPRSLRTRHPVS